MSNSTVPGYFPEQALTSAAQVSGYLSLCIWFFAQLPQILENHVNQSVEGVSVLFLSSWIAGDVTNLVGCLLTRALPFQTLIAIYYCFIDIILSFQYWYYTHIFPYHTVPHNLLQSPKVIRPRTPRLTKKPSKLLNRTNRFEASTPADISRSPSGASRSRRSNNSFVSRFLSTAVVAKKAKGVSAMAIKPENIDRSSMKSSWESSLKFVSTCFSVVAAHYNKENIGKVSAWVSSGFYLSSRTPQIIANFNNKSTHGISPYLFVFAMLGNTFYVASVGLNLWIAFHNQDPNRYQHFWDQLPFLVGSGGTTAFDWIILFQFWYYEGNAAPTHVNVSQNGPIPGFQKPDWYTNNNFGVPDVDEFDQVPHREPKNTFERHAIKETTSLLSHNDIISSPPPPHYISASLSRSNSHNPHSNITSSILNNLNSLSQTLSRPSSQTSLLSGAHGNALSPPLKTSLIPSIINSVSSVNKKLSDDNKVPFKPSDFLNDEFYHPIEHSSFSLHSK